MSVQQALSELSLTGDAFMLAMPNGDHFDCYVDGRSSSEETLRFSIADGGSLVLGEIETANATAALHSEDRDAGVERYVVVAIHPSGGGDAVLRLIHPAHS